MSTENTSSEDRSSSFLAAGLIKQLEEERQRLAGEVDRLEAALESERSRNAAEWRQFFQDAGLKNTVTGEAIQSLDDFRVWKAQFDALHHMREASSAASPAPQNPRQCTKAAIPPSDSKQSADRPQSNLMKRLPPLAFTICIIIFFIALCVFYSLDTSSAVSDKSPTSSESVNSSSHAVDYKTGYVGSINSDFIHRNTCRHADNIQEENRVYYKSVADAVADGRSKCSVCLSDTSSTAPSGSGSLVPITPPGNGEIIKDTQKEKLAPLTVKTSGSSDYYIALHCVGSSNTSTSGKGTLVKLSSYDMTFYVEGGKTAEILVPLAEYEVYYAVGDTWYGNAQKFGDDTRYYQCEDTFLFEEQWDDEGMYYSGWTLTLYTVPNGNMDTEEISASEFPA